MMGHRRKGIYRVLEVLEPRVGLFQRGLVWCSAEHVQSGEECLYIGHDAWLIVSV